VDKLFHLGVLAAEIAAVVVLYWACSYALRPDGVRVHNNTIEQVSLRDCDFSLGVSGTIRIEPGETSVVHATGACSVHTLDYIGCLPFLDDAFQRQAVVNVSSMDRFVSAELCSETGTREVPQEMPFE
jgi:hypothetical protein